MFQAKSKLTGKSYKWGCIYHVFLFLEYPSIVNAFDAFIQLTYIPWELFKKTFLFTDSRELFGEWQKILSHSRHDTVTFLTFESQINAKFV